MEEKWIAKAKTMANALKVDSRNAMIQNDPWSRAAKTMVTGWNIRLSRRPPKYKPRKPRPTWKVFASRASDNLLCAAKRTKRDPWHRWATARVTPPRRYIKKVDRAW